MFSSTIHPPHYYRHYYFEFEYYAYYLFVEFDLIFNLKMVIYNVEGYSNISPRFLYFGSFAQDELFFSRSINLLDCCCSIKSH